MKVLCYYDKIKSLQNAVVTVWLPNYVIPMHSARDELLLSLQGGKSLIHTARTFFILVPPPLKSSLPPRLLPMKSHYAYDIDELDWLFPAECFIQTPKCSKIVDGSTHLYSWIRLESRYVLCALPFQQIPESGPSVHTWLSIIEWVIDFVRKSTANTKKRQSNILLMHISLTAGMIFRVFTLNTAFVYMSMGETTAQECDSWINVQWRWYP